MDKLLNVTEVASLLQVDKQRVYALVRSNKIPVVRLGERQYRFSKQAIDTWSTKNTPDGRIYQDGDGYGFLPDPMREIPLAATVIQQLMNGASDPEGLTDMQLKMIRANANRILGEVEAIQHKRGERE